jgi:phosphate ABC transporter phosphate-binding protein
MNRVLAVLLVGAVAVLFPVRPAAAATFVPISGAGSTWSQNAVDQWRANVRQYGIVVNYAGTGSSDGRNQFRNATVDFAISEIPYDVADGAAGNTDPRPTNRDLKYMPIVAGGTSFMYNLKIGGKRVTNLRLSGDVIARLFTNRIEYWDDPAIKRDNPQLALPHRKVVPVVRSDGSGTTAQFSAWLATKHAGVWDDFCRAAKGRVCGTTSFFPTVNGKNVGQSGSLGVSGYVAQEQAEGAITYVEYSYALNSRFPVAKVRNRKDVYVAPTASAVAVGLLGARINPDLTQNLGGVYDNDDERTYPLSSYSYMLLPSRIERGFTADKGYTLGAFGYYFLCEGQRQAEVLGYSPLPVNLVQEGYKQLRGVPGNVEKPYDLRGCNNPTLSADGSNALAKNAARPPACDRFGTVQCSGDERGGSASGGGPAVSGDPSASAGVPSAGAAVDPDTGQPIGGRADAAASNVDGVPVALDTGDGWQLRHTMMLVAALMLLGAIVGPPLLARFLRGPGGTR